MPGYLESTRATIEGSNDLRTLQQIKKQSWKLVLPPRAVDTLLQGLRALVQREDASPYDRYGWRRIQYDYVYLRHKFEMIEREHGDARFPAVSRFRTRQEYVDVQLTAITMETLATQVPAIQARFLLLRCRFYICEEEHRGHVGSSKWRREDKYTWNAEVIHSPFSQQLPANCLCLYVCRGRHIGNEAIRRMSNELEPENISHGFVPEFTTHPRDYEVFLKFPDTSKVGRRRFNGVVR